MATAEEALEKMREICLSLPDTRERNHFGQAGFYVKGAKFSFALRSLEGVKLVALTLPL